MMGFRRSSLATLAFCRLAYQNSLRGRLKAVVALVIDRRQLTGLKLNDHRNEASCLLPAENSRNLGRLFIVALLVTGGLVAIALATAWLPVVTPRWLIRDASVAFLWTLLGAYVFAVLAVAIAGASLFFAVTRAWRRRDRGGLRRHMRLALLVSSSLLGILAMELGSATLIRLSMRLPALPTRFEQPSPRAAPGVTGSAGNDGLYIVVVGESSARGDPFQPWVSVGQLVAWQLEKVFPGRRIEVDVRADGGLVLEQAVLRLRDLVRRPDAMIVFAGHNEFQTRLGWSRNVAHYIDEEPTSPLALFELARAISSMCALTLNTLDLYYGQTPPPPRITRELVDHPSCTPKEYAILREDFRIRLDALTAYCKRIGSLPILIMPGSNDGSFEPDRSVLAPATPASERATFAEAFRAIRAGESADATASIAAYRRLLRQHPEFAETHYRLARLLAAAGAWEEAGRHFISARDLDGFPLRCPSDFRDVYRSVARHYGAILIDGPEVLTRVSPHGILDDHLFHDAHHPSILGVVALANEVLEQLERRRAFNWPERVPSPRIEPEDCARHYELDAQKWALVCHRSNDFYTRTAFVRFDPSARLIVADQYHRAALEFTAGRSPGPSSLAGLAIPASLVQPARARSPASSPRPLPGSDP
jgi:hypothetical protein